jgi:hypothetical protein
MQTILELENQIRHYINNPRKQHVLLRDHAVWNKLCSSLDVIDDVELALDAYLQMEPSRSEGETYLVLYGVLQMLFVQQDAVTHLAEALGISYTPDPIITSIREIRNDSVGHPTKRGGGKGKAFNFISRFSMSIRGFTLDTAYDTGVTRYQDVNILQLIDSQRNVLKTVLEAVVQQLREEEMKHKEKFKGEKLSDLFPQTLGYHFEKTGEAIYGSKPAKFGTIHVKHIIDTINHFKGALDKRGILNAYDSINDYLNLIEYPLKELAFFFENANESKLNRDDAYIFMFFVKKHIDDLIEIAIELDEKYESEP